MTPTRFGSIDWIILAAYFVAVASIGPVFARPNKSKGLLFGAWRRGRPMHNL